jgi:hypothetical protein
MVLNFCFGNVLFIECVRVCADDMIADRRKEQSKSSTGRSGANKNNSTTKPQKKTELADRSIATGRAKRSAATKARRGLSNTKKPTAMEIDQENYRQSRNSNASKKKQEQKSSNGRLPPNSSLRDNKKKNINNNNNNKNNNNNISLAPVSLGRMPNKKQMNAALQGMKQAGCPVPDGHTLIMQFIPAIVVAAPTGKGKGGHQQQQANKKGGRGGGGDGRGRGGGGRGGRK